MSIFTKEQLIEFATAILDVEKAMAANDLSGREAMASASIAEIALASLEAEAVAWMWSNRKHPSEVTLVRPEDDERAEGAHWSGWSCQALYAAPPAPVSVPDFGALTKCIVQRLVDYGAADDDAIASAEEFVYNACRSAMLHGGKS